MDSTQVAISPSKQDIVITINITEGERFVVSSIKIDGNYLGKDDEFKSLITVQPGEAYNAARVAQTTKAFTDYFVNGTLVLENGEPTSARPGLVVRGPGWKRP